MMRILENALLCAGKLLRDAVALTLCETVASALPQMGHSNTICLSIKAALLVVRNDFLTPHVPTFLVPLRNRTKVIISTLRLGVVVVC